MRFKIEKHNSYGDERIITKFLLFPKTLFLNEGRFEKQKRWLETATWREVYKNDGYVNRWIPINWRN